MRKCRFLVRFKGKLMRDAGFVISFGPLIARNPGFPLAAPIPNFRRQDRRRAWAITKNDLFLLTTDTENRIWRAPSTVCDCGSIIHAEGVSLKKMKEFRLRSPYSVHLAQGLERAKSKYQFVLTGSLLATKLGSFRSSAEASRLFRFASFPCCLRRIPSEFPACRESPGEDST